MSRFWPHPPYAEDQPHSTAILTTHVLYRGFQTGAIIGPIVGAARYAIPIVFGKKAPTTARTPPLVPMLLRATGTGAVWGVGALAVAVPVRMWGREDIEWRDRAWRLLENRGQVEVDDWGVVGMVVGGAGSLARRGGWSSWRMGVGGVGVGSTVGVLGYMVWRHGIKGGKWEEAVPDIEGVTS